MQTIREGNLYFLESPFHFRPPTDESTDLEKRLSYLLGTVSARPAVVVRAPSWWDRFNTVTVIPALSKGKPAITYSLKDRYGHVTGAVYPFVPHNPHTIPVSRLGKYIGSLDRAELDELLYAFMWVHNPDMQMDRKKYPVPDCYKDLVDGDIPASWKHNRDARANIDLVVDKDTMKIRSKNFPALTGFPLGNALEADVPDEVVDDNFVATSNPLPDEELSKEDDGHFGLIRDEEETVNPLDDDTNLPFVMTRAELSSDNSDDPTTSTDGCITETKPEYGLIVDDEQEADENPQMVPVEKDFPPSIFPIDMLNEVAGRFDFSAAYYSGDLPTRDPKYLNEDEVRSIRGTSTNAELQELFDYYKKLTPMDAYVLGPRLPTEALQRITGFTRVKTASLKRLCNLLRDIPDEEYNHRVQVEADAKAVAEAQVKAEKDAKKAADKKTKADLKEHQAKLLALVRPYLSPDRVMDITDEDTVRAFIELPMGVVKHAWNGLNFKDAYSEAKRFYKRGIKIYDSIIAEAAEATDGEKPRVESFKDVISSSNHDTPSYAHLGASTYLTEPLAAVK